MPVDLGDLSDTIKWVDWLVFGAVLAASLGIGAFYGFCGNQNKTNEEFLMAGRSMSILPVTMSLLCSFVSAVTLLGNPVEIYFYGVHYTLIAFAFIPLTLILAYLYVPVYFDLQLTSAYEYFEWRYSKKVRYVVSSFAMCHLIIYMPITVFGPSLALDQVADINYRLTAAMIFIVCILYSSVGGLKAVLWTDALQAVVMFLALSMVIGLGLKEVGGISHVWETATDGNRMNWWVWDADPRRRHTFWTATIGGYLLWLPLFGATQAQIQRYNSVPTLRQSRLTLLFNMFGMMLVICLCSLIGLIIYTNYADCDPVEAKMVKSADQLVPLFVLQVLGDYSGVPGLLIAGLTCGSLSTVSSALNSLAAILTEDYVKPFRPGLSEEKLGLISKVISAVTGCIAFGLVFIIAIVNETIQISPFSTLLHGSLLGPILAGFTLGMIFPWVNDLGMFTGMLGGVAFSLFIGIGNIIAGREDKLPIMKLNLTTVGCNFTDGEIGQDYTYEFWKEKHEDDSIALKMFSTSYIWLPGIGFVSTMILGGLFSAIVFVVNRRKSNPRVNVKLMSKPFVRFWVWLFGRQRMESIIDFVPFDFGGRMAKLEKKEGIPLDIIPDYAEMKLPRVELYTNDSRKMFNGSTELSAFAPHHRLSQQSFKKLDAF